MINIYRLKPTCTVTVPLPVPLSTQISLISLSDYTKLREVKRTKPDLNKRNLKLIKNFTVRGVINRVLASLNNVTIFPDVFAYTQCQLSTLCIWLSAITDRHEV